MDETEEKLSEERAVTAVDADFVEPVNEESAINEETAVYDESAAQTLIGNDFDEQPYDGEGGDYSSEIAVGDVLVEGLSVEANVRKFSRFIKIPEKIVQYIFAVLYMALGALCAAIPEQIEFALPYIFGGALALGSLIQFIFALVKKEYRSVHSNKTVTSLILMGLSVMIIVEHEWAHTFIPIVWGLFGLCEGAHAFNLALARISKGMRCSYYIIKGIVEVAVAFLLLYKPDQFGELHIIVFGVSLIIDGITTVPFLHKLFTRE